MNSRCPVLFALLFALAVPVLAVQPPQRQRQAARGDASTRSAEQWVRQLENELDHLQEDLYYERGQYPPGLAEQVEQASRSAAHFRHVLRRNADPQHLLRDFQQMDEQIHQLVNTLNQSGDSWLQRKAARIQHPDEQLHYVLRMMSTDRSAGSELLARHARVLQSEARNLEDLVQRVARRDQRIGNAVRTFAEEAEEFRREVDRGRSARRLRDDFRELDESWRRVVNRINRSPHGLYLRRNAQNVNRVHNQIDEILNRGRTPRQQEPPRRAEPSRERPAIEVEIPGIGRVRIPR